MSNTITTEQKFFLLDSLAKQVAAEAAKVKKTLTDGDAKLLPGAKQPILFVLEDGTEVDLGTVIRTKPSQAWKITDPEEFLAWVQESKPEAVEHVPQVRDWYVKTILAQAESFDAAITGEGEMIPGVEKTTSSTSSVQMKPGKEAKEGMKVLTAAGVFKVSDLLEVTK